MLLTLTASLILMILPWLLLIKFNPVIASVIFGSKEQLFQLIRGITVAPVPLLLFGIVVYLGFRWINFSHSGLVIGQSEQCYGLVVIYSCLSTARFFFSATQTWNGMFLNTSIPILFALIAIRIPKTAGKMLKIKYNGRSLNGFLSVLLSACIITNLAINMVFLSTLNNRLETNRGTVYTRSLNHRLT